MKAHGEKEGDTNAVTPLFCIFVQCAGVKRRFAPLLRVAACRNTIGFTLHKCPLENNPSSHGLAASTVCPVTSYRTQSDVLLCSASALATAECHYAGRLPFALHMEEAPVATSA